SVFRSLRASTSLPNSWSCCMQWAHLPPRKNRTTTFLPLWSARLQVAPVVSVPANGSAGEGDPTKGPQVARSTPLGGASPAAGRGVGGSGPALVGLPGVDEGREPPEDRGVGVSGPRQRRELLVSLPRLLGLADRLEDIHQRGERWDLIRLLLDGRSGHALGEPI